MNPKQLLTGLAMTGALAAAGWPAHAADGAWPTKSVTLIVPSAAGSGADTAARLLADELRKSFGQPFVIDNRVGANGVIGTQAAAKAPNDGYTLLLTYAAAQVVNQSLHAKPPYDGAKDFVAVAQIGAGGNLMVVAPGLPAKDLKEFIAYAKSKPAGSLSYGSWGNGSGGHLSMEVFLQQTGLQMVHIPFKSPPAVVTEIVGGRIDVGFSAIPSALPLIQSGKLKAIAVSGPYQVPGLPVRTMSEQGVKFDITSWYGLFAPAGTPPAVVNAINKEVVKILGKPEVLDKWKQALGLSEFPIKTPEQFAQTVRDDIREWGAVVKAGNIKAD